MKQIEIRYNPYRYRFAYYIDGKAVTSQSMHQSYVLPKQESPFHIWASEIFRALDMDINESYTLLFTGREIEGTILKLYQRGSRYCKDLQIRPYKVAASTAERIERLERICRTKAITVSAAQNLMVYTDDTELAQKENIEQYWPNNTICQGSVVYRDIGELYTVQGDYALVLLYHQRCSELHTQQMSFGRVYCIGCGAKPTELQCRHNVYSIDVPKECIGEQIAFFIDYEPLPYLLNRAIEECIGLIEDHNTVDCLREIDHLVSVQPLPENQDGIPFLEENQTFVPRIDCIPKDAQEPEIWFESDNPNVIRANGKMLTGVAQGKCRIIAREAGIPTLIYDKEVCCIHRDRIKEIHAAKRYVQAAQNTVIRPEFSIIPENADNTDMIRITVSDSNKAIVDRENHLITSSVGKCTVKIEAEGVFDTFELDILPRMQGYHLNPKELWMIEGKWQQISIDAEPVNAYFEPYFIRIEPDNGVLEYDDEAKRVYAVRQGRADILFRSQDGSVSSRLPVRVIGKKMLEIICAAALAAAGIVLVAVVANLLF